MIAVMVIAAYFFVSSFDRSLKASIQTYGAEITQTSVSVGAVDIAMRGGQGSVYNLRIINPNGFLPISAIKVDEISFRTDAGDIKTQQPIIIDELTIAAPAMLYAVGSDNMSNMDVIARNLNAVSRDDNQKHDATTSRKIIIKNLYIRDGVITVTHPLLRLRKIPIALPLVHLTNISGQGGVGLTSEEMTRYVLNELIKQTSLVSAAVLQKEIKTQSPFEWKMGTGKEANPMKDGIKYR